MCRYAISMREQTKPRVIEGRNATILLRMLALRSAVLLRDWLHRKLDCRLYIHRNTTEAVSYVPNL